MTRVPSTLYCSSNILRFHLDLYINFKITIKLNIFVRSSRNYDSYIVMASIINHMPVEICHCQILISWF